MLALPPLALYIHIPWCEKKCPYCDFNSHAQNQHDIPEKQYIEQLVADAKTQQQYLQGRSISSVFIGGGTPSLLSSQAYQALFTQLKDIFPFTDDCEITLEANPSSAEAAKFSGYLDAGINRLSIGVQSFQQQQLEALGRIHTSNMAVDAVHSAQQAGFKRINLDIMHGLPQQSVSAALDDLAQAIELNTEHLSWYQLTIEPNTYFYNKPPALPVEDTMADIQDAGFKVLQEAGFVQYEVSAFAKNNQHCQHNKNYWHYGDYLAIGAGAHGKVTLLNEQKVMRFNNTRLPKDYLTRIDNFKALSEYIDKEDRLFEALMNGLRLNKGVPVQKLLGYTGCNQAELSNYCKALIEDNLLTLDKNVATTAKGFQYLNTVLQQLLEQ